MRYNNDPGIGPDPCEEGWYSYVDKLDKFAAEVFAELKDELHLRSYISDIRFRESTSYVDLILDPIFADNLSSDYDASDIYEQEGAEKIQAAVQRLLPESDRYEPEFTFYGSNFDGSMWTIDLDTKDANMEWEEPEYEGE